MTSSIAQETLSLFYDALGQVTGIGNVKDGETISAYAYRYDGRGNIVYEEAAILVEGKLQKTVSTYFYDTSVHFKLSKS